MSENQITKPICITDIAKKAGVCKATVSRYLNGTLHVKGETSRKIEAAIKELNYIPNIAARTLRTKMSSSIGVIIPNISHLVFSEIVAGIESCLLPRSYAMWLLLNKNEYNVEEHCTTSLIGRGVDGVIFIGSPLGTKENEQDVRYIKQLIGNGVKVAFVNRYFNGLNFGEHIASCVNSDLYGGAKIAVSHLVSQGRKRIALLTGSLSNSESLEKLRGYREAITQNALNFEPELLAEGNFEFDEAYQAALRLLKNKPDAIFAINDTMAIACIKAIRDNGLIVPDDVAVIGWGDTTLCKMTDPQLTSINQQSFNLGFKSANLLLDQINSENLSNTNISLPTSLVVRESA